MVWTSGRVHGLNHRGHCVQCFVPMQGSTTLWLIAGVLATAVVAAIALMRRQRPDDLGSVSAAWTTEHNIGDRGGDRSNG